jgi:hypothetical protein
MGDKDDARAKWRSCHPWGGGASVLRRAVLPL